MCQPLTDAIERKQLARYSLLVMVGRTCLVQTLAFLFPCLVQTLAFLFR